MTTPNNPRDTNTQILSEEELRKTLKENVWGYGCKPCGTSGTLENNVVCTNCNGLGIVDWELDLAIEKIQALFAQQAEAVAEKAFMSGYEGGFDAVGKYRPAEAYQDWKKPS